MPSVTKARLVELEAAEKRLKKFENGRAFANSFLTTLELYLLRTPFKQWPRIVKLAFETAQAKDRKGADEYKSSIQPLSKRVKP